MSHITIIIGSGRSAEAGEQDRVQAEVAYTPDHDMSWDDIGKEVAKIEKRIDSLLD